MSVIFVTGLEGISNKLKASTKTGISTVSLPSRTEFFGNNYREPIKAKTFCKIFLEALDDFMLKVLIVAATGSLAFEYIGADPDHYSTGKCQVMPVVRLWPSLIFSGALEGLTVSSGLVALRGRAIAPLQK